MGRWTTSNGELDHLVKIVYQMDTEQGTVVLKDGQQLFGIILPGGVATNDSGQRQADVIVRIKKEAGQFIDHKIDVLDVSEIIPGRIN